MTSTRGRLPVLGGNPFHGSDALDSRMRACLWDLSLGQRTGDGRFDGETFLGGLLIFFLGGRWRGRGTTAEAFSQDDASSKQPCLCYILYIEQWKFRCSMRQTIANGGPDPRLPWADTCAVRLRQPVDLVHALTTVKGLLLLVPPRTPRSSGYDVYAHAVYVVICSMSITYTCYMSVICG